MDSPNIANNCLICAKPIGKKSKTKVNPVNFKIIKEHTAVWKDAGHTTYDTCIVLCLKYEKKSWTALFHRTCYQDLTNITLIQRLPEERKVAVNSKQDDAPKPSSSKSVTTRSDVGTSQKKSNDICIICNKSSDDSSDQLHSVSTVSLFDGMHIVNSITKKCEIISTVEDFANVFKNRISNASMKFDQVGVVFDRYIEGSLKEQTRKKRTGNVAIEYSAKSNTSLKNVTIKNFLSHIKTKAELTKYLSRFMIQNSAIESLLVTYDQITEGNVFVPEELRTHSHEEADTLLILHAVSAPKDAILVVECADTDVFMWLLAHYKEIAKDTYFQTSKLKRLIKIEDAVAAVSKERIDAIIGICLLTGSDKSGRMRKVTKDSAFKLFLESDPVTLNGLKQMTRTDVSAEEIFSQIEEFICKLHKSPCITLADTRWFMKNVKELDCEELPPSKSALIPHIQRAQFQSIFIKNCTVAHPKQVNILDYGYMLCDSTIVPVMSSKPRAPDIVLKVNRCNCKTSCMTMRCSCKFASVPCSDLCGCVVYGCVNVPELVEKPITEEDISSDDDSDLEELDEM